MHTGDAPSSQRILIAPAIVRAICAPTVEHTTFAGHLCTHRVDIDSQSVHLNCLWLFKAYEPEGSGLFRHLTCRSRLHACTAGPVPSERARHRNVAASLV